jgi:hypothetical protein
LTLPIADGKLNSHINTTRPALRQTYSPYDPIQSTTRRAHSLQIIHRKNESILVRQRRSKLAAKPSLLPTNSELQGDQRELHDSGREVPVDQLAKLGVMYYRLSDEADVDRLALERSYKNRDVITVSPDKMGDVYEEKVRTFFNEHLHEDEEIRYVRDGTGFFDIRSEGDEWIRIQLEKDDLIVSACLGRGV